MRFLKKRIHIKNFFTTPKRKIYCQTCGYDITEIGALITESGEVYCHDYLPCLEQGLLRTENKLPVTLDFVAPADIQEEIEKGTPYSYHLPSK